MRRIAAIALAALTTACIAPEPEGLAPAAPAAVSVRFDWYAKPMPDIPLPNDIATRYDESSATRRRINASLLAPSELERGVRRRLDALDGWGVFQPISIPFDGPIDLASVLAGHRDPSYGFEDDAVLLVNVTPDSPSFGDVHPLDVGNGNYPVVMEYPENFGPFDPRGDTLSLFFEEYDEDRDGDGVLDPGEDRDGDGDLDDGEDDDGDGRLDSPEDTDSDGVLDRPNYLPGATPSWRDLAGRADALASFWEVETNTLLVRPLEPLDERTTYAVVVTRRIHDRAGDPIGSPFEFVNHAAQTADLEPLLEVMPPGLALDDIAFAFSFTTQTVQSGFVAVRDGLYGHGVQAHLATDYPAELATIAPARDRAFFPNMVNAQLLYAEDWITALLGLGGNLTGASTDSEQIAQLVAAARHVDFFVLGSFVSPQLYERTGPDGALLPWNDQAWPEDLDRVAAKARPETVYFTLSVPRREVSVRGEGRPAPVMLQGHGSGSSRFEGMLLAGFYAKQGLATFAIEGPGHGLGLSPLARSLAQGLFEQYGLAIASESLFESRAVDLDGDDVPDSGADFWTSYVFHTRDMMRQSTLDFMQAVRILRGFDGSQRWRFDLDGDGEPELAGDFDGDGVVDLGGEVDYSMFGISLGGMQTMMMGALEPAMAAIAPLSGGGGLGDIGIRSNNSGAVTAFVIRMMGPMYLGELSGDTLTVYQYVPSLTTQIAAEIGWLHGVHERDTVVAENLDNGERGCGFIAGDGTVRVAVASDLGDRHQVLLYHGPQLLAGGRCVLRDGATPYASLDAFQRNVDFEGVTHSLGEPLIALAEGLALHRADPALRRFAGLGQMVLDPGDPASYARQLLRAPLTYPGTGEVTGTHVLQMTILGDPTVPTATGVAWGRAAGLIDAHTVDPRFGVSANQYLIDTYTVEGVDTLERTLNEAGDGVHLDLENFSHATDLWGTSQPRAEVPARIGWDATDALGGRSASLFPMGDPHGQHAFDLPGVQTDILRDACARDCPQPGVGADPDPCGCSREIGFDVGNFMVNMVARYLASGGTLLDDDLCMSRNDCSGTPAEPAPRDTQTLP